MYHDKPRLLIIGARGFLGQHLARRASEGFQVVEAGLRKPGWDGRAMDVTSAASVEEGFRNAAPDVVVLLAALSDIDACQAHPQLAEAINVEGAAHVVGACARAGARLVFTSSAAVFDGARHGYGENDTPTPLSVYGSTKARAEEFILRSLPSALVLRVALAVGFAQNGGTNAMLNKFQEKLRAGQEVLLPDFEYRNPIDPVTFADFVLELAQNRDASGIFHVGAGEPISRYELGVKLAERLGSARHLVKPQTAPLPGRAPRGQDHFLLTERIRAICRTPVPSCEQVIERAIDGSSQGNL
jgi:dTDP-4-dehydrorhamnose reductase